MVLNDIYPDSAKRIIELASASEEACLEAVDDQRILA